MRIAFFGLPLAAWLLHLDGHQLDPVVLSPLPAPGRRRVKRLFGAKLIDALELPTRELEAQVQAALPGADLLLSWFWTRKLPPRWLSACPRGAFGVHPSLLPRHRGPDPFFWAIDCGDSLTGVSLHRLEAEYDTGAVIWQDFLGVGELTAWQLAKALDRPSLRLLRRAAGDLAAGLSLPEQRQDERLATAAPAPSGDLLKCPWREPGPVVLRRVRALSPQPGVALELRGLRFDLLDAQIDDDLPLALRPGEAFITAGSSAGVLIRTGSGGVRLLRARLESGAEVDAAGLAELVSVQTEVLECSPILGGNQ